MQRFGKVFILVVALVLVFMGSPGIAKKPAVTNTLNIITINLMQYTPIEQWSSRADKLVSFVRDQEDSGEPVDIILCQEGHSGLASLILNGTENTINDLQRRLSDQGLSYQVQSIISFGDPDFPQFSKYLVGVLSRHPIVATDQGEIFCGADPDSTTRSALACLIKVPRLGLVAAYSVHISPYCMNDGDQAGQLLDFVGAVTTDQEPKVTILGGDFNSVSTSDLHNSLVDADFVDTFTPTSENPGYTFNVPGNPFTSGTPIRIDYIFARAEGKTGMEVLDSKVVLDDVAGDFMSDHCGVLSQIEVTAPPKGGKPKP